MSHNMDAPQVETRLIPPTGEEQAAASRTLKRSAVRLGLQEAEEALGIQGTVWLGDLSGFTVEISGMDATGLRLQHRCGWNADINGVAHLANVVVLARTHTECS